MASAGSLPFVQIKGRILSFDTYTDPGQKRRVVAHFSDGSGVVDLVWFHGLRYVTQNYKIGQEYIVFGRPTIFQQRWQFAHPDMEKVGETNVTEMGMQPYYMTTEKMKDRGMTSLSL